MHIAIPNLSVVALIGPSGSGKSTFARKHFLPTEVLASDACRALECDNENNQTVTKHAFEILHHIARKRLELGRLVVIDATNVQKEARNPIIQLAKEYHVLPLAIVFNLPEKICHERNQIRDDRNFGAHVVRQQRSQLRKSLARLRREGFRHVFVFESPEEVDEATLERVPLWTDKREEHGPFDIIGDIHGCCDELEDLLGNLGYEPGTMKTGESVYGHPEGRKAIFLGDLVDRGPRIIDTVQLVRSMVKAGHAICVPGNHDMKLVRSLMGKKVQISYGLASTLAEIDALPDHQQKQCKEQIVEFLDGLVSHFVLDDGKLVVAHAGMKEEMQGRASGKVREFALYGETTGETDEFGLPVRYNWAAEYRGSAMVVYGHTPVIQPEWLNRTVNIDTGCVFGGKLTALRYPEKEFVSVEAAETYCEPVRPLQASNEPELSSQQVHDDLLDAEDVIGKRFISTRLRATVTIREQNATAALEVMSRFAANPKWLIYLPPTMSPCETSNQDGFLEHPTQAFDYFQNQGIAKVVCEAKHMGSRAIVVICRNEEIARQRFGVLGELGIICTRTGRRFFNDSSLENKMLQRIREAMTACSFWSKFESDWACLDCELMPWSSKAQELLRTQYAAVGSAATASLPKVISALADAWERINEEGRQDIEELLSKYRQGNLNSEKFVAAYRQYCWPVRSLDDFKLAPFHLMATEDKLHIDRDHVWHMETLADLCKHDEKLLLATPHRVIDPADDSSRDAGVQWWHDLTEQGGEGMVVKPFHFITRGKRGLVQPAIKCRGREYLRIIYGPDYTSESNLQRLRNRALSTKRSLALREFALGIEALERFVRQEPLRRVHECVFGVLALESEPVDPRL